MPDILLYSDSMITLASGETAKVSDILSKPTFSYSSGLTAHASGGQSGALALVSAINVVSTVATAADSVALPKAVPGSVVYVVNAAASNSMQVFGTTPDTINGVATGTGVAQAAGKSAAYMCAASGAWFRVLSA